MFPYKGLIIVETVFSITFAFFFLEVSTGIYSFLADIPFCLWDFGLDVLEKSLALLQSLDNLYGLLFY
jgi:hypothetical protein